MRELARTGAKAVGGMVVGFGLLGLIEGSLALVGVPDPGLYDGDPAWVWTVRPDLELDLPSPGGGTFRVETNSLGLRGALPPEEGPWTLALGCSTTFGWGVDGDEAWPALLSEHLDEPVINGGIPGWSTAQAVRGVEALLALGPSRVIVGYLVRDAQAAARTDAQARQTPWLLQSHLARLMQGTRAPATTGPSTGAADLPTHRVPPEAYARNLDTIAELAGGAELVWLAFPEVEPSAPWRAELATRAPSLAPELPREDFFADDPIHLTVAGNAHLAKWLAERL